MKRYEERKQELLNATERLKEALQEKESDIIIDGTLHRFEFTFGNGIIEDGENWIKMMLARNSLSHLYDEEKSREIYMEIKVIYLNLFEKLNKKFADIL